MPACKRTVSRRIFAEIEPRERTFKCDYLKRPDGHKILAKQIAGAVARRVVTYVKEAAKLHDRRSAWVYKTGFQEWIFLPWIAKY